MNRKQRRALKKNNAEQKLAQKISSFDHRPDNCSACNAPFDAKSKEHATTWHVVVKENQSRVSLFCPDCIKKTQEILNERTKENK